MIQIGKEGRLSIVDDMAKDLAGDLGFWSTSIVKMKTFYVTDKKLIPEYDDKKGVTVKHT